MRIQAYGLGDIEAELDFFNIDNGNHGLGTFSSAEQYDQPLQKVGVARIAVGDDFITGNAIDRVDAIKIDVQGLEPEVLIGLKNTLFRDRPLVWLEVGAGTRVNMATVRDIEKLFPYPIAINRLDGPFHAEASDTPLSNGNYTVTESCSPQISRSDS